MRWIFACRLPARWGAAFIVFCTQQNSQRRSAVSGISGQQHLSIAISSGQQPAAAAAGGHAASIHRPA